MKTTIGQLLVNEILPEDMVDYDRVLDKKGLFAMLRDLAQRHPEKYREVTHKLNQVGLRAAQESGGYSFGLRHMRKSKAGKAVSARIHEKLVEVLNDDNLSDEDREKLIIQAAGREMEGQKGAIFDEAKADKNPLAYQVMSGSRGNPMNLASLLGSDVLYTDHHDRVIPVPVTSSYAQGLRPEEYWAGTYGARKGVMATKFATQEAGFLSKQLNQMTHRLVVTDTDHDGEPDTVRGMPVDTDDPDSEGSLLGNPVGGYKRNTVLTPKILHNLKRQGVKRILVRSPTVGGSPEGGIYGRDAGVREKGDLPGRGENIGLAAAQALSEPLSQSQLSAKHSGGVAGEEKGLSGFAYINQLIQVPKTFKGGAAHSQEDGIVGRVEEAPAGGQYIYINSKKHFVGAGYALKVKRGDTIEAGDVLSEGVPNPAEIVKYKGVGEGRRYFTQAFRQAMNEAGLSSSRRNAELLSRGLINHVRLTEEYGQHVPDDVVPYATMEHEWKPREGTQRLPVKGAVGRYLEKPVLHYSIGTRIRKSMLKDFEDFGVDEVDAHDDEPPFKPEMIRGMYSVQHDPDWMTRLYGSGQKKSLLSAAHRGGTSDELGTSFIPSIARGIDFGRQGLTKQPALGKAAEMDKEAAGGLFGPAMGSEGSMFDGSGSAPRNQFGGRNELAGQIGTAQYGGSSGPRFGQRAGGNNSGGAGGGLGGGGGLGFKTYSETAGGRAKPGGNLQGGNQAGGQYGGGGGGGSNPYGGGGGSNPYGGGGGGRQEPLSVGTAVKDFAVGTASFMGKAMGGYMAARAAGKPAVRALARYGSQAGRNMGRASRVGNFLRSASNKARGALHKPGTINAAITAARAGKGLSAAKTIGQGLLAPKSLVSKTGVGAVGGMHALGAIIGSYKDFTDPRSFDEMSEKHLRDTQNYGWGNAAETILSLGTSEMFKGRGLRASTVHGIYRGAQGLGKELGNMGRNRKKIQNVSSGQNKQYAQGPQSQQLQQWGATPEVAAKYQKKWTGEGNQRNLGWVNRGTGQAVGAAGQAEIDTARAHGAANLEYQDAEKSMAQAKQLSANGDHYGAQQATQRAQDQYKGYQGYFTPQGRGGQSSLHGQKGYQERTMDFAQPAQGQATAPQSPQQAPQSPQQAPQSRATYNPNSLLANRNYQNLAASMSKQYGGGAGAMMMLSGADPEAFKSIERAFTGKQQPAQAAAAVAKPRAKAAPVAKERPAWTDPYAGDTTGWQ